ncbi:hypothetical protein DERF_013090 [Dermatophagoides farinae]|uniref:Uncharacterized protein n=1 Tax=Dermatophagoides farinae TaxID=6954 RepID=A0A922HNT4_DERFA|nr:hypothetical protein DERF_013090 [Dermatophagoides farinae]
MKIVTVIQTNLHHHHLTNLIIIISDQPLHWCPCGPPIMSNKNNNNKLKLKFNPLLSPEILVISIQHVV